MASLEPDRLLDRRRLKRGVVIWRALAIVALVAAALVGAVPFVFDDGERVARLWVSGMIEDDPGRDRLIADLRGDDSVKAVAAATRFRRGHGGRWRGTLSQPALPRRREARGCRARHHRDLGRIHGGARRRSRACPRGVDHGLDRGAVPDRGVHRAPGGDRGARGGDPQRAAEGEAFGITSNWTTPHAKPCEAS